MSLRRQGLKGSVISVQIKTPQLQTISRQVSLDHYTWLEHEIRDVAMKLVREHWRIGVPIRAITVGVTKLVPADQATEQMDLFDLLGEKKETGKAREKQDKMEAAVDALRQKMGSTAVTLGVQQNEDIGIRRGWKKKKQEGEGQEKKKQTRKKKKDKDDAGEAPQGENA